MPLLARTLTVTLLLLAAGAGDARAVPAASTVLVDRPTGFGSRPFDGVGESSSGTHEVIANRRTARHLARHRAAIEAGALEGPPGIDPLILPTRVFSHRLELTVGRLTIELIQADIHSDDATAISLPQARLRLCGDRMEDTIAFVDQPQSLDTHLRELERLAERVPNRILPNHGDPDRIAAGGYSSDLIRATQHHIRALQHCRTNPELAHHDLRDLIAESQDAERASYFAPHEAIHAQNVDRVLGR